MIQRGTFLSVIDNSGARKVQCIGLYNGFKKRFANLGDTILITVKRLRAKRREFVKAKKGQIYKALIVRVKNQSNFKGNCFSFKENAVVILNQKNKLLGTRIFGGIPQQLRYTKFLKLASLAFGIIK
jgi:large subunit ribosomal protein L14